MPLPTPLHPRTSSLCSSLRWKEWAGYHAVCSYDTCHEPEYFAVRHAAGLLDATPLYKYVVRGPDAAAFLAYATVRDITRLEVGQTTYCCWCDPEGKALDDGTVTRLDDELFRVTSADPSLAWFQRLATGFELSIEDVSAELCALALQGPTSRAILQAVCGDEIAGLRFFRAMSAKVDGVELEITRTGYTGDLGYELWVANSDALKVWDVLMEAGRPHGILPLGLDALDVTRVEAGFILMGVDYISARRCLTPAQSSTPYEIGLGWTVQLNRGPFIGSPALEREKREGSAHAMVGLDVDWVELEELFDRLGLPPSVPHGAWRTPVPVYSGRQQVGRATSGSWSPILKKNLAIASVDAAHGAPGTELGIEITVEYERKTVKATVVERPFFNPPRKRS